MSLKCVVIRAKEVWHAKLVYNSLISQIFHILSFQLYTHHQLHKLHSWIKVASSSCLCMLPSLFLHFLLSSLYGWVPLFSACASDVCRVSDPCSRLPCFLSSSLLGTHGALQKVSNASSHLLAHCDTCVVVVTYVTFFSFLPPQLVSATLFHMRQRCVQCQWYLLTTALFSLFFTTGNTWNITESE